MNRYAPIIIVAIVGLAAVAAGVVLYRVYKPQVLAVSRDLLNIVIIADYLKHRNP